MTLKKLENELKRNSNALKKSAKIPKVNLETIKNKDKIIIKCNIKKISLSIGGLAAAFIILANCIPEITYASKDIPILNSIIRVITSGKFEIKKDGYELNTVTPEIKGLLNKELENKLNNEFKEHSKAVISAFENDISELKKVYGEDFSLGVEASYVIRTDNENILAIDTYIVNTVASSSTKHSFYTIYKKTGQLLDLKSLFKKNTDYITPISQYITEEMKKRNDTENAMFWLKNDENFDGFEKIKENQNFFINNKGNIVICFDKYEVAAGAQGCPEFEIPKEIVKDISHFSFDK